jgi:transcriptional regulator with XRE-family HTH domain
VIGPADLYLEDADAEMLARRIGAWMAMHRVSTCDMADALGIPRTGLSRLVNSKRPVSVELALRICDYTGLEITGDSVKYDPKWKPR